jgi:hypothetical protein
VWDLGGNTKDLANLEYTKDKPTDGVPGRDEIQPDVRVGLCHIFYFMLCRFLHWNSTEVKRLLL